VTFQVDNPATSQTATAQIYVFVVAAVSLPTGPLPGGGVGQPYLNGVAAFNGTAANYQWSITSGSLPAGLTLTNGSPACRISGTPTTTGTSNFTLEVQDGSATASQAYSIVIGSALSITTTSLSAASSGAAYSATITATGGDGNYTWALQSVLPSGLALTGGSPSATIDGTTADSGDFTVRLMVKDGANQSAYATLALTVTPGAFSISTTGLPDGLIAAAYSQTLTATGGTVTAWSIVAGVLPYGISLATDTIAGTPQSSGVYTFTVKADESGGASHRVSLTLTINSAASALTVTTTSLARATEGTVYTEYLTAYGGTNTGYSWAVVAGSLPSGVSISGDELTGTPAATGTFNLTFEVTDSGANTAQASLTLEVDASSGSPAILTTSLPNGDSDEDYAAAIRAAGGTPPYVWTLLSGSLPTGTALTSRTPDAALAGVASAGSYSFTIRLTDSLGLTASQAFSVDITGGTPLAIDTYLLASPTLGVAYNFAVSASGGSGTGYSWSVEGGDLPFGLTLTSGTPAATISGTPGVPGAFRFALRVTDSGGKTAVKVYLVTVASGQPLLVYIPEYRQQLWDGIAWSMDVYATGGTGIGYDWSTSTIPSGYTLTPNGSIATLSGTPVAGSPPTFSLVCTDSGAGTSTYPLTLPVGSTPFPPVISTFLTTRMPGGKVGKSWRLELGAAGGVGTGYSWSIASGSLPPGLVLNTENTVAVIEGVPLATGNWTFGLLLEDGAGSAAGRVLSCEVRDTSSLYSQALGSQVAFVLDRSGSMGGARYRTLRAEMENTVLHMEPGDSLDIVTFESTIGVLWGQLRQATPANRAEALAFVHGPPLYPAGTTATYPALEYALSTYPTSLETLAVVSDGSPSTGGSASQILAAFPGWFAPYTSASVLSVGIGVSGAARTFLQYLAIYGNGVYTDG
jgi:hypothetical protein